uniref:Uncharacterized protein n=1 Tax=Magallana gigas TaxID=29159 RepID=K1PAY9_MAGGI
MSKEAAISAPGFVRSGADQKPLSSEDGGSPKRHCAKRTANKKEEGFTSALIGPYQVNAEDIKSLDGSNWITDQKEMSLIRQEIKEEIFRGNICFFFSPLSTLIFRNWRL